MKSGEISDKQISASSQQNSTHAASHGRLNFTESSGTAGAWSAKTSDANQWLQVNLGGRCIKVTRVATQGRNDADEWVTKYKLQYGNDGDNFKFYREQGQNTSKVKLGFLHLHVH